MSTIMLGKNAYWKVRARKSTQHTTEYRLLDVFVMRAIRANHLFRLDSAALALLLYLTNRTTRFCKVAEAIYAGTFDKPIEDPETGEEIACALNMADTTRERALKRLTESGYVKVYRCENRSLGLPPIYEVDCAMILGYPIKDEETDMPLREALSAGAKARAEARIAAKAEKLAGRGREISLSDREKQQAREGEKLSRNLREPTPQSAVTKPRDIQPRERATSLSASRGARAEPRSTASEKLKQLQSAAIAKQTVRLASAAAKPAHQITKEELQALLDTAREQFASLGFPRTVVTGKTLAVLRRRLKATPPDDLRKFIQQTMITWADFVARYNRMATKRAKDGDLSALQHPFGKYFNVEDLAYRYPYLLKVYQNTGGAAPAAETDTAKLEIDRLRRALAATKQEKAAVERLLRERSSGRSSATTTPAPRRAAPPRATALTDEEVDRMFAETLAMEPSA